MSSFLTKKRAGQKVGLKGSLRLKHTRDSVVLLDKTIKNVVVNVGLAEVAGLINEVTSGGFTYLAIGVGTTPADATDNDLESEITTGGGERAAAACSRVTTAETNDTAQMVKEWTFSASFSVTESGPFDAAAAGVLLAHQVFSAINVVADDKLEVTWKIQVS